MAGFGGSVKLTGESEYRKALSQITQSLKVVSSEMKSTSSAFESGDKSSKDLASVSQQLSASLEKQKSALATLKSTLATMSAEYTKTGQAHSKLVQEYEAEKTKLDQIGKTLGTSSSEYQKQQKVVTNLAQEVDKSAKAYDSQGKALNDMKIKTANAETTANQTAKALNNLGKEAEESGEKAKKGGDGFTVMKGILANLGTQAINSAMNGLMNLGNVFASTGKQALASYGDYEQLEGGVKKIFGDDMAKVVEENANKAFSTAGMSANEYLETVTGFSSSLIQSLNGDTAKATEISDRAIRDMSDNANTFGTSMDSLQTAYQGFAKGNFTLLDNLKIGYGGTKEEAQRLLQDASKLNDVQKELGVTIDSNDLSFANVANAISVVQKNMGIMGTTSNEASTTIQGSVASMKSAWQNMLTGMADDNANFGQLVSNFVNTLITEDGQGGVIGAILPRISTVITGIATLMQTLLPQLMQAIVPIIMENVPILVEAVNSAINTILAILPTVLPTISNLIPQIATTIIGLLPQLLVVGIRMITSIIDGITQAIPQLLETLPTIITNIVEVITDYFPDILQTGLDLLVALTDGIMSAIPQLVEQLPNIITSIVDTLLASIPQIVDTGVKLLTSLADNLPQIIQNISNALPTLIVGIVTGLMNNLPTIIQAGVTLLVALVKNVPAIIKGLLGAVPTIIKGLVKGIVDHKSDLANAGLNLIKGLWEGIKNAKDWLMDKIKGFMDKVTGGIKKFFGIHSPSRLFRDEIGKYLAQGIGVGFEDEMKDVTKDMQDSMPTSFDMDTKINGIQASKPSESSNTYSNMVNAFKDALGQMKIEMNDEEMGKFVDKTVSNLVYA